MATLRTGAGPEVTVTLAFEGGSVFIAAGALESAISSTATEASATNLYRLLARSAPREPGPTAPLPAQDEGGLLLAEISIVPPVGLAITDGMVFPGSQHLATQRVWQWDAETAAAARGPFTVTTAVDRCELELDVDA